MCAILQLVSAPINPIPIAEHFRRSHPQCEHSYGQHVYRIICELTVIFSFESKSRRRTVLPDLVFSKLRKSLELECLSEFLVPYVSRRDLRSADRLLFC